MLRVDERNKQPLHCLPNHLISIEEIGGVCIDILIVMVGCFLAEKSLSGNTWIWSVENWHALRKVEKLDYERIRRIDVCSCSSVWYYWWSDNNTKIVWRWGYRSTAEELIFMLGLVPPLLLSPHHKSFLNYSDAHHDQIIINTATTQHRSHYTILLL